MTPTRKGWVFSFAVVPTLVLGATVLSTTVPTASASTPAASEAQGWYHEVVTDLAPLQTSSWRAFRQPSRGSRARSRDRWLASPSPGPCPRSKG